MRPTAGRCRAVTCWSLAVALHALAFGLLAWATSIILAPAGSGEPAYPAAMAWLAPAPPVPVAPPAPPLPLADPAAGESMDPVPPTMPAPSIVSMAETIVEEDAAPLILGAGAERAVAAAFRPRRAREGGRAKAPGVQSPAGGDPAASAPGIAAGQAAAGPGVLARTEPGYPRSARRAGRQGTVRLAVRLDPLGAIEDVAVDATSGHEDLDAAAVEAVRHWRFAGTGATAAIRIAVVFRLEAEGI